MTFASLFTGGGLADIGARAAGLELAWGLELQPLITEVANRNLGGHVVTGDILQTNPRRFEPVDVLHASPPCPNFSPAKTNGAETALDIALAEKIAEFVRVLAPRVFVLENVPAYLHSRSWALIQAALYKLGYWLHIAVLNAADYGVPQTRRRLVVRAVRDGFVPSLPVKTPWRGWFDAIADLVPGLPESEFALWQLERLPAALGTMLVSSGGSHFKGGVKQVARFSPDEPAMTVVTGTGGRARAFIVHATSKRTMSVRDASSPVFTCMAGSGHALNMPRAYLVDGAQTRSKETREPTTREGSRPAFTMTANGTCSTHRALFEGGRVVKMNPRALARFQGIPDSYELPDNKSLACRIVGNACCPPLFEQLYRGLA